jgi:hypothetical protein
VAPLSLTGRILQFVVWFCCVRPKVTVIVALATAALCTGYSAHYLTFETSKFHLLPLHQRYATLYKDYAEDFGQLEDIVVVVESPAVETSTAYAVRLASALRDNIPGTARISYRIDASRLEAHALLYLPFETLERTLQTVASHEDLLADFAATPTLDRLVNGINQWIGATFLPGAFGPGGEEGVGTAPIRLLGDLLTQMSDRIDGTPYRSPWASLIAAPTLAPDGGYFLSHDRRLLFVVIDLAQAPRTFAAEHAAILAVRSTIASLRQEFPSVEAGVTGAPALFSDELSSATRDGEIAGLLSMVLTLGLLVLAFRHLLASVAMLAALTLSLAWSLAATTLLVGHLTILSMMFVSIVVGLGTDYGTFFLFRYREERVLGRTFLGALERTAARSGPGILLGALTAAVTFYILMTAEFQGIRDFGFISGTAILFSFLSMVTVFPAAVLLIDRWQKAPRLMAVDHEPTAARPSEARTDDRGRSEIPALEWLARHPKTIIVTAVVATGASLWAAPRIAFDYNLLNLQANGTESVVWERKAAEAAGRSVFAALSTATSLADLEAKQAAFARLPSVSDVQSVLSVLPDRQADKLPLLQRLAAVVDSIRLGPPRPLDLRALTAALETLKRRMDVVSAPRGGEGPPEEILVIARATSALLERLKARERGAAEVALADYQARLAADFAQQWRRLQVATRPAPLTLGDLPEELRRRFIGKSGSLLLQVYSRHDPWESASQALRRGAAQRRPGRHRTAGRRVRVDAAHRELVPAGTPVRLRPRRRHRGAHDPPGEGDRPRDGPAHHRDAVDGRGHGAVRAQIESRQRLGVSAHHRLGRRIRPVHRAPLPRAAGARWGTAAGPQHGPGRHVQRPHDDHGLREPARGAPSRRVEPRLAARDRLRDDADHLAGGAAHAHAPPGRAPANSGRGARPGAHHRGSPCGRQWSGRPGLRAEPGATGTT